MHYFDCDYASFICLFCEPDMRFMYCALLIVGSDGALLVVGLYFDERQAFLLWLLLDNDNGF